MLLLLLVALALILVMLQTRTIRGRIEKQGLAIAKNLAAISVDSLVTYNYVALEKLANQAVNNPDILYVIIHDKEGRVAGYSKRPDLQNKILTDNHSINVTKVIEPLVSIYIPEFETNKIMEIVVPVYLSDSPERWGIVRVRLSLELMYQQIRQTYLSIFILGSIALTIGILISDWAAQRVTKPLDTLVKASIEVAKGNLEQNIAINTNDEV
ncbi:MAG: cell wall metabolism sensor histidine kinase WalK, partial [Desulfobacteraceae bacterium]|nr:cell wall metabolism sensor histidine kinase WalK [Desulfobacteraceae bacterium]